MNIFGCFFALLIIIAIFLHEKNRISGKIYKIILSIFVIVFIAYGIYQLSAADFLGKVYPGGHYDIGGWIAIILGMVCLIRILFGIRKNKI